MNKKKLEELQKLGASFAILDKISAEKLMKIALATNQSPTELLHAAIDIFEKFLGREIVLKGDDKYDLKIRAFKRYKKISKLI